MKTIIIGCDGTWQDSDGGTFEVPTNVTRLCRAVKSHDKNGKAQVVYYQSGVGTGYGLTSRLIGGTTGDGLSENVREAYGFLAQNYYSGDNVVLIGFSRGAYTARSICGLIARIGILTKRGMDNFHQIFQDYQASKLRDQSHVNSIKNRDGGTWVHPNSNYVCAIGCFDTVGSLGIPSLGVIKWRDFNKKYEFHDTELSTETVGYAFHALALDEHRGPFTPALWEAPPQPEMQAQHGPHVRKPTILRQCWFPGVHTNIGGGYDDQEIADVTLAWMVQQLNDIAGCVEFDDDYLTYIIVNDDNHREAHWAEGKIYNSATGVFKMVSGNYRTPGQYVMKHGGQTHETIHPCVRVRYELMTKNMKPPLWDCKALKGWGFIRDEDVKDRIAFKWVKKDSSGNVVSQLKEEPLGIVEKRLAGQKIIEKYLGKECWEGVPDVDVEKAVARVGSEQLQPVYVSDGVQTNGNGVNGVNGAGPAAPQVNGN